jgi:hypothetical protein
MVIKSTLVKTTIQNEQDVPKLEEDMETQYLETFKEIEDFFSFVGINTNQLINAERLDQEPPAPIDPKKPAQKAPDKGKKGGKDDLGAYESPLEATPGGIESLVLLLDSSFNQLPLEYLNVFSGIPAIARDFSFQFQARRLRSI